MERTGSRRVDFPMKDESSCYLSAGNSLNTLFAGDCATAGHSAELLQLRIAKRQ